MALNGEWGMGNRGENNAFSRFLTHFQTSYIADRLTGQGFARRQLGFAINRQARHDTRPNRVRLTSSLDWGGLVIHLRLLSTPSHKDAVTMSYKVQTKLRQGLPPCKFNALTGAPVTTSWLKFVTTKEKTEGRNANEFAAIYENWRCPIRICLEIVSRY